MKIYHTETQADYDALMVELERQGCKWCSGFKMKKVTNNWEQHANHTCVRVDGRIAFYDEKDYYAMKYPSIPIIKYKAKVDEKMRFTKENVEKVIDEYFWQADLESCGDLIAEIYNLDDTPEKVVVPKFVADYLEERKRDGDGLVTSLYPFQGNSGELIEDWFEEEENNVSFAKAWIYGYTIEKEPQYMVSIMDLGIDRIILMKNRLGYIFELESENDGHWEVHFTEQQIKEYDKRYWAFAIPAEGKK